MLSILYVILIIGSFIGMIVFGKVKTDHKFAKPITVSLFILLIIFSFLLYDNLTSTGADYQAYLKRQEAGTYFLGKEIAKQMPGAKVLIIRGIKTDTPDEYTDAQIEGLKKGFGEKITDIKTIHPPKPELIKKEVVDEMQWTETKKWSAADFDKILEENSDRNLIIMMTPFPEDSDNIKLWDDFYKKPKSTPKIVLLNNDISYLASYVAYGFIPAMITDKPGSERDSSVPSNLKECFDKYFILITKDNIKQIAKQYPNIFLN